MPLTPGSRIASYEIVAAIGAGGMGTVYRARDARLRRDVALKILQDEGVRGASATARLLHEARAAASLNHPNICVVHEVGEADGVPFIVMELVGGESLDHIIRGGPLPADRVCRLGRQLATGLEHAHASGIVHGDLKPANVMVTRDGRVKILDFGIARHLDVKATDATATATATGSGAIAATLPYVAPELLQGKSPDVGSDVWALGVCLYEMVAGHRPFAESTAAELGAAILRDSPRALDTRTPIALRRIIQRCLAKTAEDRFPRAGEVAASLEVIETAALQPEAHARDSAPPEALPTSLTLRRIWIPAAAIVLTVAAAAAALVAGWPRKRSPEVAADADLPVQLTRFATSARDPVISPDGRLLAFVVQDPGRLTTQVYVKALPDGRLTQLTRGPEAKAWPAFSPDNGRIAYTVTSDEWKWDTWIVDVNGGTPQPMMPNANSLRWTDDGRVLFSEFKRGSQLAVVVSEEGRRNQRDLYVPPLNGMAHYSDVSPDGTALLIGEMVGTRARCFVMPVDGGPQREVVSGKTPCMMLARWSPDGRFVYFVAGTPGDYQVWRQPAAGGPAEPVTSGRGVLLRGLVPGGFAVSRDSRSIIYSAGEAQESLWLRRADGSVTQLSFEGDARAPSVSADGRRVFYIASPRFKPGPIRMRTLSTDEDRPLAIGQKADAVWASPDGNRFVFTTPDAEGRFHLWLGTSDNRAAPQQVTSGPQTERAAVFAPTGKAVYYSSTDASATTLWSLNLETGQRDRISEPAPISALVSVSPNNEWLSVIHNVTPRETWLYPTRAGSAPRRLYVSWRLEWTPGNRSFLLSNSGMISTAWSLPNPGKAAVPPLSSAPTAAEIERLGGREVLAADFFVDPVALPEPGTIVYAHVESRSNLFRKSIRSR